MPKKILVVEDEPDILKIVEFRLKKLECEVISAVTGNEAYELIKSVKPDLIILDYILPDMNGLEISRRVRAGIEHKLTPIILLSAYNCEEITSAVKGAVVNEYLKKPFDPYELLEIVRKYL